ncbi:hypothetical protein GCM10011575_17460 [Microlunatus endophyticus]|uniref:Uncharacterized protein n=1 Tax=Microlunatus endophyticus TaxID=1716077 RepID=A0A917S654_9ACTN|nr:DUF6492 family protein [Microlunatus endophyticus]GGL59412.1 hypothetical protein GCM10011575_17460 [Microlunatus endophyticus]
MTELPAGTPRGADQPISAVTVVFEAELDLLKLQARSLARFAGPEVISQIIVIDNTRSGIRPPVRRKILHEYGIHRPKVVFLRPTEIGVVPPASGWITQQVLKLLVYSKVAADHYVVLDAKNHLIRQVDIRDFIAADGRAHGGFHSYVGHPLRSRLEDVLHYLGLEPQEFVDRFPPTHTPFVLQTRLVGAMVEDISSTSGQEFASAFVASGALEFFLYSGWIRKTYGTWDAVFDGEPVRSANIWPGNPSAESVKAVIAEASRLDTPFFAAHRTALAKSSPFAATQLARFWCERELFGGLASGIRYLGTFKLRYVAAMSLRKLRTRPARGLS